MNLRFDGKTAIVTGAASGIGYAIAEALSNSGAKAILADIDLARAAAAAEAIGNGALAVEVDVTNPQSVQTMVTDVMTSAGKLDILVNNAGIAGPLEPVGEYSVDHWHEVLNVNLHGAFYGIRYAVPAMKESGGGAIINIASVLGSVGFAGASAYVASKHALVGLTKTAAIDHADHNIRINSVGPGFILTALVESSLDETERAEAASGHALNRMGKTEEVASLVLYLLSDEASFITGSHHLVDGGYTAK